MQRSVQLIPKIGQVVNDPKGIKGRRQITIGPNAVAVLKSHRTAQAESRLAVGALWEDGHWVFTRPDGQHLSPAVVSHEFKNLVRKLDLAPGRLHDLRHTHATLLLAARVHPKVVQERLGHANISITLDTYSHVLPGLQEKAALAFEEVVDGVAEAGL